MDSHGNPLELLTESPKEVPRDVSEEAPGNTLQQAFKKAPRDFSAQSSGLGPLEHFVQLCLCNFSQQRKLTDPSDIRILTSPKSKR